jgi:hypothetical protein
MKTIILIVTALFITSAITAQDTTRVPLSKEELKKKRKEEKAAKFEAEYQQTKAIINSKCFVLEANFLSNQRGNRSFVNSLLNFIAIDTTSVTIQVGSNRGIGYNGVGGITTTGKILDWKLTTNEKSKSTYIRMSVMTSLGNYDISMDISADGNAYATLTGITYGQLNFDGKIVPKNESVVYKGTTTY